MITTLPYITSERPKALGVSKSTIMVWTAISLILVETFSGALRFYLDAAGASALMYLPKVLCLTLFALELATLKIGRAFWLGLLLLTIYSVLGMLHGATLSNIGFALFIYSPLLFGMVCGVHLEHRKRLLGWVIGFCLVASLLGILLDRFTAVPWKGYSYNLGETTLSGNTAWSASGTDRLAGFARMSTGAAMMIAIFSLYLGSFTRSRLVQAALYGTALAGIVLTTNKSTAAAFVIALGMMMVASRPLLCRAIFFITVGMGIALPAASLLMNFDVHATTGDSSLASLYDRLVNTWPTVVKMIDQEGWSLFGAGFGMIGSSVALFPLFDVNVPYVTDNSALYLWGAFGVLGLVMYALLMPLLTQLRDKPTFMSAALLGITFCITLISWTTDVLEVSVAALFLGLAVSHVLLRKAMPTQTAPADLRETDRDNFPTAFKPL